MARCSEANWRLNILCINFYPLLHRSGSCCLCVAVDALGCWLLLLCSASSSWDTIRYFVPFAPTEIHWKLPEIEHAFTLYVDAAKYHTNTSVPGTKVPVHRYFPSPMRRIHSTSSSLAKHRTQHSRCCAPLLVLQRVERCVSHISCHDGCVWHGQTLTFRIQCVRNEYNAMRFTVTHNPSACSVYEWKNERVCCAFRF